MKSESVSKQILAAADQKCLKSSVNLLATAFLSGGLLAIATLFAWKGGDGLLAGQATLVSGLLFPSGFALIAFLGLELITGNFVVLPYGALGRRVNGKSILRNYYFVLCGNLIGSLVAGVLFAFASTNGSFQASEFLALKCASVCEAKTVYYAELGLLGWATALVKGVLCNWMVALGSVVGLVSTNQVTKIVATWLPIAMFFTLGYEHLVVNLFVLPTGILLGARVSLADAIIWNVVPVATGNMLGAFLLVAVPVWWGFGVGATSESG